MLMKMGEMILSRFVKERERKAEGKKERKKERKK